MTCKKPHTYLPGKQESFSIVELMNTLSSKARSGKFMLNNKHFVTNVNLDIYKRF